MEQDYTYTTEEFEMDGVIWITERKIGAEDGVVYFENTHPKDQ